MSVQDDIGASVPPRWRVYRDARELAKLAQMAAELATEGPRCDVARAALVLDRMRAILGNPA